MGMQWCVSPAQTLSQYVTPGSQRQGRSTHAESNLTLTTQSWRRRVEKLSRAFSEHHGDSADMCVHAARGRVRCALRHQLKVGIVRWVGPTGIHLAILFRVESTLGVVR